jgi:hypothetical protein
LAAGIIEALKTKHSVEFQKTAVEKYEINVIAQQYLDVIKGL